ncbi:MAG: threonine--tRNA ligase [Candidatus Marinimicrobia bacterium]|jgi:threonyl-tRNA synthetase|nr:threonine--tRNA ligase [Candidatus Neomarinimicrobiota bacterium]MBT3634870.1 threonine--tRNA ligase [Candidatus Neomarinimicrobiota bacterium]MBT3682768.1 threonine--tRNA ligase [Candidatus Neomarinimicrobiota bacterium]MBT3759577.1 threonine--tRNA ligase [Candidatus Neomarinimicrobiota bacterium]MBT3894551.1 threonine--tRNA ligase [Candidatus Neomarinimicrobiota bacterium]
MENIINITLPDGSIKSVEAGSSPADIALSIGEGLLRSSVAARIDGVLIDLNTPINSDASIELITSRSEEAHDILLHSTAHLMAQAVKELYPDVKITIGPSIKNQFYYDFDLDYAFNDSDLEKIEIKMKEISKRNLIVNRLEFSRQEAIEEFTKLNEDYKVEIIEGISDDDRISAYRQGEFIDLCKGPHIPSTGKIKYFKLLSTSGAYWRGDEKNKMLKRIYGTSFFDKKALRAYLLMLEEAKKRDHRKLGKELEIFTFDEEVGPGLPLWLPNGATMVDELEKLAKSTERNAGYVQVRTPHLTKGILYERSGHLEHYKKDMFPAMDIDGTEYYVKPMNCPHHHKIYDAKKRSYRDLPVRLAEYGTCYRYEKSGQLFGLMRVRSMQMNDAHIYCTPDQFKDEFLAVCKMYSEYFEIFGIEKYQMRLSVHSKEGLGDKFVDEPELWEQTEKSVREALVEGKIDFVESVGDAAFYGPKIDVQVWSAIGKEFTLATNQVDFAIPSRFGLTYTDEHGKELTPLCIHRAPLSTHERFIGFLIEHFAGDFPLWLAPIQVIIIPVSEKYHTYANEVKDQFFNSEIRVEMDDRSEKVGAKIRLAEIRKIPVMLIVGEREMEEQTLSVRRRHEGDIGSFPLNLTIEELKSEIISKSRRYSE